MSDSDDHPGNHDDQEDENPPSTKPETGPKKNKKQSEGWSVSFPFEIEVENLNISNVITAFAAGCALFRIFKRRRIPSPFDLLCLNAGALLFCGPSACHRCKKETRYEALRTIPDYILHIAMAVWYS